MQYVRARVTGPLPIRDSVTRESVEPGGVVRLLVRDPNANRLPRCPRHPVRGVRRPVETCICGSVLIDPLVTSGAIELVPDEPVKPAKRG